MTNSICPRCGQAWSVLQDGTLVEHPLLETPDLLCPGSRTRSPLEPGEKLSLGGRKKRVRQESAHPVFASPMNGARR
jgi:hypothetical protein